jgi:hypothetical protein
MPVVVRNLVDCAAYCAQSTSITGKSSGLRHGILVSFGLAAVASHCIMQASGAQPGARVRWRWCYGLHGQMVLIIIIIIIIEGGRLEECHDESVREVADQVS